MTNIELLTLYRLLQGTGDDEDWILSIPFVDNDGNAVDLSGISFVASLALFGVVTATTSGVVTGNLVTFIIFAAAKASWAQSNYSVSVLATDGTYTKDILSASSILAVGSPSPQVLTTLNGGAASLGAVSMQTSVNTTAISALQLIVDGLQAAQGITTVSASASVGGPGTYVVTVPSVVLTLMLGARNGTVRIKALYAPVTVVDTNGSVFEAGGSTFILSNTDESVTFTWWEEGSSWLVG